MKIVKGKDLEKGNWFMNEDPEDKRSWSVVKKYSKNRYDLYYHQDYLVRDGKRDLIEWSLEKSDVESDFIVFEKGDIDLLKLRE